MRVYMQQSFISTCLILCSFISQIAYASPAIDWILSTQNADGSYFTSTDVATASQSTSETLTTFVALQQQAQAGFPLALNFINAETYLNTENISRRIIANSDAGLPVAVLLDELALYQNLDGGFGDLPGYHSTAIDTAYALLAMAAAAYDVIDVQDSAITYLRQQQAADGSFILSDHNQSSIYITSLSARALQHYIYGFDVSNEIHAANEFLLAQQLAGGGWGAEWESASALLSIVTATTDATRYAESVQWLRDQQLVNGSWAEDVFTTALVLRALKLTENVKTPLVPTVGEIKGRTVNAGTGAFIAEVTISIEQLADVTILSGIDGHFALTELPPGSYTLRYEAGGFATATQDFKIVAGQVIDLGQVTVTPLPDTGVVSGIVTDATSGAPVIGALVQLSGVTVASTTTNTSGHYSFASGPGSVMVTVSALDYETEFATGNVVAGGTLVYSPGLQSAGTIDPDPFVTIKGVVVDGNTGLPLENALIQVIGTASTILSSANGSFKLTGVAAGELLIAVARDQYQSMHYASLANEGSKLDIGLVHLFPVEIQTASTVAGTVKDAVTGAVISGAWVSVEGQDISAATDGTGHYSIEGVAGSEFTLAISATGYLGADRTVSVIGPTNVALDIELERAAVTNIDIIDIHIETGITSYPANAELEVDAILYNSGTTDRQVRIFYKILDSGNRIIAEGEAPAVAFGADPVTGVLTIPSAQVVEFGVEWFTGRHVPGAYQVVAQVYDGLSGQLLAERGMQVTVVPTKTLGGHAEFDPPITQLAGNRPVQIKARVSNQGNQVTDASTVTARVTLKNQGFQPPRASIFSENLVIDEGLSNPRGMDRDAAGNIYVANSNANTVSIVAPDGSVAEFAAGFVTPTDVDVTTGNDVYVLNRFNSYIRIAADGSRSTINTGLSFQQGIEALDDGRVLVATRDGLYEVTPAGVVNLIVSDGLSSPQGMAVDNQGAVYVANTGENSITRYKDGALSTFVEAVNRPYGIAVDAGDHLIVTSFGDNSLLRIAPDKTITTITSGLAGPYDVKIDANGDYIVTNNFSSEIVRVTPDGVISVIVSQSINTPSAMTFDAANNLYIGNGSGGKITKRSSDGTLTRFGSQISLPGAMLPDGNGGVIVLEAGSTLSHVSGDGARTVIADNLSGGTDVLDAPDGNGYLVSESRKKQITRIDASGQLSAYATSLLQQPRNIRSATDGTIYFITAVGDLIRVNADATVQTIVAGISDPYGLAIDGDGNIYTSENGTRQVLKISPTGTVSVLAATAFSPGALAVFATGEVLVSQYGTGNLFRIDATGTVSNFAVLGSTVYTDMLADASGNLWVPDYVSNRLLKRDATGVETLYTITGNPKGVESDGAGGVYVSTTGSVKRVSANGTISTWLTDSHLSTGMVGLAVDTGFRLWVLADNGAMFRFAPDLSFDRHYNPLGFVQGMAYDDTGALIVASNNTVLRLNQVASLPEVIASGNFFNIGKEAGNSVLLSTSKAVKRLDLSTGAITEVASGYLNLSSLAVSADGRFAAGDGGRNEVSLFAVDGAELDRFVGLNNPKGLALDATGRLFVANSNPDAISRVTGSGAVTAFADISNAKYLYSGSNDHLVVTSGERLIELDPSGNVVTNARYPSVDLFGVISDAHGKRLTVSDEGALLQFNADASFTTIASGLGFARDVELDPDGNVVIADSTRDVIHQLHADHSTSVRYANIPGAKSIAHDSAGRAFVLYLNSRVVIFDTDGTRRDLPMPDITIQDLDNIMMVDDRSFLGAMYDKDTVIKVTFDPLYPDITPGEVVYTSTVALSSLSLTDDQVTLDFGTWTPAVSGDYLLEIVADNPTVDGNMVNTLHVGPNASADINLPEMILPPGDVAVNASLLVSGVDSTSVTKIDTDNVYLATESGGIGARGVTADTQGNIYVADSRRLVKIEPDGTISNISLNFNPDTLVSDSKDNIYTLGLTSELLYRITPAGTVSQLAQSDRIIRGVFVDNEDRVYVVDDSGTLSQVLTDGFLKTVNTVGSPWPRGLTMDGFGNYYILNRFGFDKHVITKIGRDGVSSNFFDKAIFEFEGFNVTADCSNNLLFAPMHLPPHITHSEETTVVQLVGDTGETRTVLYGPPIDFALGDIDVMQYDRFGGRILMWSDFSNGKVFAFPVVCGGIDTELHLVTRVDVDLSSTDPAPDSIIDLPDGTREYVWQLADVDDAGQPIALNMLFKGLSEGESRLAFNDAFMQFNNAFDPGAPVRLPVTIPQIGVSSRMELNTTIDAAQYPRDTLVNISSVVNNGGVNTFNGSLNVSVIDANGALVIGLAGVAINNLAPQANQSYGQVWDTAGTLSGDYRIAASLLDATGVVIASTETGISIFANETGEGVITATVSTDKPEYLSWDQLVVNARVRNVTTNAIQLPGTATITVVQPDGTLFFSDTLPVRELYPASYQDLAETITLSDVPPGQYAVNIDVFATNGDLLSAGTASFFVSSALTQALTGSVVATPSSVNAGETVVCSVQINNLSASTIDPMLVSQQAVNPATAGIITEVQITELLAANASLTTSHTVDTSALAQGNYLCLLIATVNGVARPLAATGFQVVQAVLPPIANAGPDQAAIIGQTMILDGSASSSPDGYMLNYQWNIVSAPAGSTAVLADASEVNPSLTVDQRGSYGIELTVNDGTLASVPDTVVIDVVNTPSLANAGPDQTVYIGQTVTLDATASTDFEGDALSYQWSILSKPAGSVSVLSSATAAMPELTIDSHGSYTLQLVVHDGYDFSAPDTVMLNVGNVKPVAQAGLDQAVQIGQTITLDGSASTDADGDALSYRWELVSQPVESSTQLSSIDTAITTLGIDAHGSYQLHLVVNDGFGDSGVDVVLLDVINVKPVANAGTDMSVYVNDVVTLDGAASMDADGDDLNYIWGLLSKPAGSSATLVNQATISPELTIDTHGIYIVQLIVGDGIENSEPDTVVLNVINVRPVANAGTDQTVTKGSDVILNGTGYDADGDVLSYQWSLLSQPAGSRASLMNPTAQISQFVTDQVGVYIAQLIADDGRLASEPDTITVTAVNQAPVCERANAQPNALWPPNHKFNTITLHGITDPDGDALTLIIAGISQDEPVNAAGDGNTGPDAIIDGEHVQLRSERTGGGNGRVYSIYFTADDGIEQCTGSVTVSVPHNKKDSAIDDGQYYDATR